MLHVIQYLLFIGIYLLGFVREIPHDISTITIIFISITYRLYFKTMKNLYYTFWTFSAAIFFFILYKMFNLYFMTQFESVFMIYSLILVLLLCECYFLVSPIYYPRVNWWEYDFRFRADLKLYICKKGSSVEEKIEARLSDVRRKACCISVFDDLQVGSNYMIYLPSDLSFEVEVMSSRQYSLGRATNYGVRFILVDEVEIKKYKRFENDWNEHKYNKKQMKFKNSETV